MLRSFGFANERHQMRIASQESHYLNEAEDMLGRIAWKDVGEVPELAEEYWKIKEIGLQQEKLEAEIKGIEEANEALTDKRDTLEFDSEDKLNAITGKKTESMRKAIEQMHELEASRTAAALTKKKYSGLRIKFKLLDQEGAGPDKTTPVVRAMEKLKVQYGEDKKRITDLTNEIHGAEVRVQQIEEKIEIIRNDARKKMSEMMNRVSKSSKQVADFTARIGALEVTKHALCYKIGCFLSANYKSGDADLQPLMRKYRNILAKIQQLRQSIHYRRILAGRDADHE